MHPLHQRLRELDWDTFQRLVFQLLSEKHPGLNIRHVEEAGGDRGLDLFCSELKNRPAIWQCKHFGNGLGPRQRPQVKESLRAALKYFKPVQWILVVCVDLDRKGHEWFQKLQRAYAGNTAVGLFQASDIVRELIHRRQLRDAFFPGAVFDTISVRRAIQEMPARSSEELQQSASEQIDEVIARLEEADARFNYQIVYGPNLGADIALIAPASPLLMASVIDDKKRIDVYARDMEALALDPPKLDVTIKGSGVAKFQEFLRTGQRQEFGVDEISNPSSTLAFLMPKGQVNGWKMILAPSAIVTKINLELRVTFANSSDQIRYEMVKFQLSSAGTEQVDIESISTLPFVLAFTLPLVRNGEGTIRIQERYEGADVRAVAKAIRAMSCLRAGGNVELFALEMEKSLGLLAVTAMAGSEERRAFEELVSVVAEVSEIYNVDFRLPAKIKLSDLRDIALLSAVAKGEVLPFESVSAILVKSKENEESTIAYAAQRLQVLAQFPCLDPAPEIFGISVNTGPISVHAKEADIDDPESFVQRYRAADYGEGVAIRFLLREVRGQLGHVNPGTKIMVKPSESRT